MNVVSSVRKRQLLLLKKELKCWESMFERKHGRKPTKVHVHLTPICDLLQCSHISDKESGYGIRTTILLTLRPRARSLLQGKRIV